EDLVGSFLELLYKAFFDILVGPRRNRVLKTFQLTGQGRRKKGGHDADHLSHFDEEAFEIENCSEDPPGVFLMGSLGPFRQTFLPQKTPDSPEPKVAEENAACRGVGVEESKSGRAGCHGSANST